MKKLMIMAVALLTAGIASAQVTYSIGYINTNVNIKNAPSQSLNGFTISLDDNINLAGNLNVAPGIGMDLSFGNYKPFLVEQKVKKFGLYVPVDLNYGFALGSDLKLFVYAGPTLDFGIIYKGKVDDNTFDYYKKEDGNLSRFDLLLGGGAWITYQDVLRFKVGYKAGMLNTCKTDGSEFKNNVLSVSVGYVF